MKPYARRNKRLPLRCKYWHRGMAKSNTRKHNERRKFLDQKVCDSLPSWLNASYAEFEGPAFAPVPSKKIRMY
jgi:hypothetical protein